MHTIRLRKPWTRKNHATQDVERVDVPDVESPSASESSTWSYTRRFQCPTAVLDQIRVEIFVGGWSGRLIQATLNDQELTIEDVDGDLGFAWEVAKHLRTSNELVLTFQSLGKEARLSGEVELRIDD